jgi:hypothetical protein
VTALKESQAYPIGLNVTDEDLAALNLFKDSFHGEWSDTIKPQGSGSWCILPQPSNQSERREKSGGSGPKLP